MHDKFSSTYERQRTRWMSVLTVCPAQLHSKNGYCIK